MPNDRHSMTSRPIELVCYGLILAYFAFQAWRWIRQEGQDNRDVKTDIAVQVQLDELRAEVKDLRQEIDRLKTPESQRQPVE